MSCLLGYGFTKGVALVIQCATDVPKVHGAKQGILGPLEEDVPQRPATPRSRRGLSRLTAFRGQGNGHPGPSIRRHSARQQGTSVELNRT